MNERTRRSEGRFADALVGTAAGVVASLVMDRLDWFLFRHEDERARRRTQDVRPGGMDPGHVVADRMARAMGRELHPRHDNVPGRLVHFGFGVAPAAVYGMLRRDVPALTAGFGTAFGLGLFVVHDEGLNTISGLAARPGDYPWQAHARGLVAHIAYGLVLETCLRFADGFRDGRSGPQPVRL